MKCFLISSAALALMSSAAFAADLPVYEAPPEMVAPTPVVSNWSGFYVGLHGGYGWADLDDDDDGVDFGDADLEGAVIGGQIGVNWQWNMFVLGVEGDASWSGINDEDDFDPADGDVETIGYDWLASVRGRLGLGWDRFLVYGTGGVGFADFDDDGIDPDGDDDVDIGWVAGGGAEFLVTDNVSVGAEYLHYEFDETFDDDALGDAFDTSVDVIRGRVNVKFNSLFGG
jgi:outer membrane immunogenic protein